MPHSYKPRHINIGRISFFIRSIPHHLLTNLYVPTSSTFFNVFISIKTVNISNYISRDQFNQQNPGLSLPTTQSLSISPELRLISHLASLGQHPTTIGMSRLSCGFCASRIQLLNTAPRIGGKYWNIKGTLDIIVCQPMECTQDVEKVYIYSHVLRILHLTKGNIRRKWKDKNGKRHMREWEELRIQLRNRLTEEERKTFNV